jgi:predicted nucleic acid-binding protein
MRPVSNTSPISNLAGIGHLPLLKTQFSQIRDPREVDTNSGPTRSSFLGVLSRHLHRREAEAIALAVDIRVDIVIIDEQEGRQFTAHPGRALSSKQQG